MIIAVFDKNTGKGKPCGKSHIPKGNRCRSGESGTSGKTGGPGGPGKTGRSPGRKKLSPKETKRVALKAVEAETKRRKEKGIKITNEGLADLAVSAALITAGFTVSDMIGEAAGRGLVNAVKFAEGVQDDEQPATKEREAKSKRGAAPGNGKDAAAAKKRNEIRIKEAELRRKQAELRARAAKKRKENEGKDKDKDEGKDKK